MEILADFRLPAQMEAELKMIFLSRLSMVMVDQLQLLFYTFGNGLEPNGIMLIEQLALLVLIMLKLMWQVVFLSHLVLLEAQLMWLSNLLSAL